MPENENPAKHLVSKAKEGVFISSWAVALILSTFTGLGTYAYEAGQKTDQLLRNQEEIKELKETVKEINAHLIATDKTVGETTSHHEADEIQIQLLNRLLAAALDNSSERYKEKKRRE